MDEPQFPTCHICGDRLGVYEPVVLVDPERHRETSLIREPHLQDDPQARLAHPRCVPGPEAPLSA